MPSQTDTHSGMVTKKGRFGTDPYIIFVKTGHRGRSFGHGHKKGRFGTDPYIIFSQTPDVEDTDPYIISANTGCR